VIALEMSDPEAHDVHHALSTTVELIDQVGHVPANAPLAGAARNRLVVVAQRLDHERRHRGAVPNPNAERSYEQGVEDGLLRHTWMRDGVTYVGNGTYTLAQAREMVEADLGIKLPGAL
jgi:hypothetical protein